MSQSISLYARISSPETRLNSFSEFHLICEPTRDPEQFLEPDKLDITRSENPHLAFGKGTHFCLGASLGRLEAQIAINTIVRRFRNLCLDTDQIEWHENPALRGMKSMPVAFNP